MINQNIMTQKKKQWIMSEEQYNMFCSWRQSFYKNICTNNQLQYFPDEKLMKYYVWNMVCFLRSRKSQADRPFKFQKVIFTAVCLFKRYYLINSFVDEEPMQTCICALYLAFKLNEYPDDYIIKMAITLRGKQAFESKRGHFHFGEDGYADKEFKLLSGIGFQTARTKMIPTIQSLYGKIQESDAKNIEGLLIQIKNNLLKVYVSPSLMFVEDGPRIGLGVVLASLQKVNCAVDLKKVFGQKFMEMLQEKKVEIQNIKNKIQKLQTYKNLTLSKINKSPLSKTRIQKVSEVSCKTRIDDFGTVKLYKTVRSTKLEKKC